MATAKPVMNLFYYSAIENARRHGRAFIKLPYASKYSARAYLEQRFTGAAIEVIQLPLWILYLYNAIEWIRGRQLQDEDLAELLHSLGLMLKSGLPIIEALTELADDGGLNAGSLLALDLRDSIRSGMSVTETIDRYGKNIPPTVRYLIKIGESSGTLDRTLLDSAAHLKRIVLLKQDTYKVMIYPAFIIATTAATAWFWAVYVLPNVFDMFRQMHVQLPATTVAVMKAIHVYNQHATLYTELILFIVLLTVLTVRQSEWLRYNLYRLAYHAPVTKILVRASAMAFITEYLSLLIASGINLAECLEIMAQSLENRMYRQKIKDIRAGVLRGNTLSNGLRESGVFPGLVVRLVKVGEQSGNLDYQLRVLAEEFGRRFNYTISTITEIVKPLVILIAGAFFIFMVVVFLLPIYDLIKQVSAR
ncbi:MAG: type II secretion system F family protein [Methylobacter sp.]|nr:type II secretion system F family protein [Candidatus Methylobacter titanis]